MTACLVIRNPSSRHCLGEDALDRVLHVAREAGWDVSVASTEYEGHATEIAKSAAETGMDVIVVNGGDGTLNEAINGIAGSDVALGVLPAGTANVWAKETRVNRKDAESAMRDIVDGDRVRIDLGRADGRYFLLMAGIGLDAIVVPRVGSRMKRWLGASAYIVVGVIAALRTRPWQVQLRIDGVASETSLYWMLLGNTRSYGGLTDITHLAVADDGLLDTAIMHRGGAWRLLADGLRLLRKRLATSPNIDYVKARSVEVETPGIPVQLDGEYWGETPMRFEVAPLALTAIVRPGLRTPLIRREG